MAAPRSGAAPCKVLRIRVQPHDATRHRERESPRGLVDDAGRATGDRRYVGCQRIAQHGELESMESEQPVGLRYLASGAPGSSLDFVVTVHVRPVQSLRDDLADGRLP